MKKMVLNQSKLDTLSNKTMLSILGGGYYSIYSEAGNWVCYVSANTLDTANAFAKKYYGEKGYAEVYNP